MLSFRVHVTCSAKRRVGREAGVVLLCASHKSGGGVHWAVRAVLRIGSHVVTVVHLASSGVNYVLTARKPGEWTEEMVLP